MSGTKAGGLKAAATNKRLHGSDFYAKIGAKGGKHCGKKGFALMDKEKVRAAGKRGGSKSKRGEAIPHDKIAEIRTLCLDGMPLAEIARRTGVSVTTVNRIVNP